MKISSDLLNKYLNGECTPEEKIQVESYLESEKNKVSDVPDHQVKMMDVQIWDDLKPIISDNKGTRVAWLHKKRVWQYAAAAVIFFIAGFFGYYSLIDNVKEGGLAYFHDYPTLKTKRGEKRKHVLPDGSVVHLNYETQLKIPERFEDDRRVVYLSGHAHFNVIRDPDKPFIIYTQDSKTQVLGTSFDINTIKEEGKTEIIVVSGKVAFSEKDDANNSVTLTANHRALLNPNQDIQTGIVNADELSAWKNNRLVFTDQKLSEVIKILEPWYDIQIIVKKPDVLNMHFNLNMDDPELNALMKALSFLGEFEYEIQGNKVIVY